MKPNRPLCVFLLAGLLALGSAGCSHFSKREREPERPRKRTFALAVTVNRVLQPTPAQWANIQALVAGELAKQGMVLVTDLALADRIIRIDFTPDLDDPENAGHARILSVRRNPLTTLATTTSVGRYPTSFSYLGSFHNASWGYGSYSPFYGWSDPYYNGYSYGSANLDPVSPPVTTTPTQPPHRPQPGYDNCPAPSDRYVRPLPARFGGDYAQVPVNDFPRAPSGRWRSGDAGSTTTTVALAPNNRATSDTGGDRSTGRWRASGSGTDTVRAYVRSESFARSERGNATYPRSESSRSRSERSSPDRRHSSDDSSWRNRRSDYSPSYSSSYSNSDYSSSSSSSSSSSVSSSYTSSPSFSSSPSPVSSSDISTSAMSGPVASSSSSSSGDSSSNQHQH